MNECDNIPAPLVSSVMTVEPQWIDYNGHFNMAYYNVLFDRAVDEVYEPLGIGPSYPKRANHATMTARKAMAEAAAPDLKGR